MESWFAGIALMALLTGAPLLFCYVVVKRIERDDTDQVFVHPDDLPAGKSKGVDDAKGTTGKAS